MASGCRWSRCVSPAAFRVTVRTHATSSSRHAITAWWRKGTDWRSAPSARTWTCPASSTGTSTTLSSWTGSGAITPTSTIRPGARSRCPWRTLTVPTPASACILSRVRNSSRAASRRARWNLPRSDWPVPAPRWPLCCCPPSSRVCSASSTPSFHASSWTGCSRARTASCSCRSSSS